jgi:hypothetical protein
MSDEGPTLIDIEHSELDEPVPPFPLKEKIHYGTVIDLAVSKKENDPPASTFERLLADGSFIGLPVCRDHDMLKEPNKGHKPIGKVVLASRQGQRVVVGIRLRAGCQVADEVENRINNRDWRQLSLAHRPKENGDCKLLEVSVCKVAARPNCVLASRKSDSAPAAAPAPGAVVFTAGSMLYDDVPTGAELTAPVVLASAGTGSPDMSGQPDTTQLQAQLQAAQTQQAQIQAQLQAAAAATQTQAQATPSQPTPAPAQAAAVAQVPAQAAPAAAPAPAPSQTPSATAHPAPVTPAPAQPAAAPGVHQVPFGQTSVPVNLSLLAPPAFPSFQAAMHLPPPQAAPSASDQLMMQLGQEGIRQLINGKFGSIAPPLAAAPKQAVCDETPAAASTTPTGRAPMETSDSVANKAEATTEQAAVTQQQAPAPQQQQQQAPAPTEAAPVQQQQQQAAPQQQQQPAAPAAPAQPQASIGNAGPSAELKRICDMALKHIDQGDIPADLPGLAVVRALVASGNVDAAFGIIESAHTASKARSAKAHRTDALGATATGPAQPVVAASRNTPLPPPPAIGQSSGRWPLEAAPEGSGKATATHRPGLVVLASARESSVQTEDRFRKWAPTMYERNPWAADNLALQRARALECVRRGYERFSRHVPATAKVVAASKADWPTKVAEDTVVYASVGSSPSNDGVDLIMDNVQRLCDMMETMSAQWARSAFSVGGTKRKTYDV